MTEESDTLVIGGGIIGLMTARELACRGHAVTVVDRGRLGAEASRAAGGILCPLYPWRQAQAVQSLAALAMAQYPALVETLAEDSGCRIGFRRTGLLVLDREEFPAALAWADRWRIPVESLSPERLAALEPALATDGEALFFPRMANVYPVDLIRALRQEALDLGIRLREDLEVTDLLIARGRVEGVRSARGRLACRRMVVAGGAWSALLVERLGHRLPVRPVRGQIIQYPHGSSGLSRMVLSGGRYLVPRPDGELIVGSTIEEAGFDASTTDAARISLSRAALDVLPELASREPESHWAGLRPGAPDGLPFIGPWNLPGDEIEGLYLNTGHYQNGILLAPVSGRLLAQMMSGEAPLIDPAAFAVSRLSS